MQQENTYKKTLIERTSGIKISGHLRIIETVVTIEEMNIINEPRLELYDAFLEFHRLGRFYDYLNKHSAQKLVDYLQEWLKKHV